MTLKSRSTFSLPDIHSLRFSVEKYLENESVNTVFILSDEVYNLAQTDKDFKDELDKADMLLASNTLMAREIIKSLDETTVVIEGKENDFSKYEYNPFDEIMSVIASQNATVFILTQDETELERCSIMLKMSIPDVNSWEKCCEDIEASSESVINEINGIAPDVLMCSFDSPFEEKWILDNRDKMNAKMVLGIGPGVKKAKKYKSTLKGYMMRLLRKKE